MSEGSAIGNAGGIHPSRKASALDHVSKDASVWVWTKEGRVAATLIVAEMPKTVRVSLDVWGINERTPYAKLDTSAVVSDMMTGNVRWEAACRAIDELLVEKLGYPPTGHHSNEMKWMESILGAPCTQVI